LLSDELVLLEGRCSAEFTSAQLLRVLGVVLDQALLSIFMLLGKRSCVLELP